MAKFHINKHGVPAPCLAKEGNCPLGGSSGNENHFNTAEEAQEFVDKNNEREHQLLPSTNATRYNFKISEEAFDEAYGPEGWAEDGMTLAAGSDFLKTEIPEAFEGLPDDLKSIASVDDGFVAVSEGNAREFLARNVLSEAYIFTDEMNVKIGSYYKNEIVPSMMKHYPDAFRLDPKYNHVITVDKKRFADILTFATDKLSEESNLSINGSKIYVDGDFEETDKYSGNFFNRNWIEEYAASEKEKGE